MHFPRSLHTSLIKFNFFPSHIVEIKSQCLRNIQKPRVSKRRTTGNIKMEQSSSGRRNKRTRGGIEENILAILDATDSKDNQDADDDRIAFLDAVRGACFDEDNCYPPTNKMYQAVFQILTNGESVELIMESYGLLCELEKRFPRVHLSNKEAKPSDLVVVEEAWSPFAFNLDNTSGGRGTAGIISGPFDSSAFHLLIHDLAEVTDESSFQTFNIKSLANMLLFQYLISVLEGDLLSRNKAYEETMNWVLLRESLLSLLLSSRRINYKSLMKDCLSIICGLSQFSNSCVENPSQSGIPPAIALALPEVQSGTFTAMQKLLKIILELDASRKKADAQGSTTRADCVRTPLVEIILDELTYDRDMLDQFLQIFKEPKWKMEIILLYFSKYIAKPPVRTRRSNGQIEDDGTFLRVLKGFSNATSTKTITKKIDKDIVQILLAHAFQAHLSSPSSLEDADGSSNSLVEICENLISAFRSLRKTDEYMEISPLGKEAVFTAATILSINS